MMQSYWLVPDEVVILQLPSMHCAQQCGKGFEWNSIPRLYQIHASQDSMSFLLECIPENQTAFFQKGRGVPGFQELPGADYH